jgi:lysophospholipase L1-like esterase
MTVSSGRALARPPTARRIRLEGSPRWIRGRWGLWVATHADRSLIEDKKGSQMRKPRRMVHRFIPFIALVTFLASAWASTATASSPTTGSDALVAAHGHRSIYLALGDSAPIWDGPNSYPDLIAAHFAKGGQKLKLVNMACSGETTSSMLSGSTCAPGGSQLNTATAFLRSHQGSVALITIDIGGNDLVYCGGLTGISRSCVKKAEKTVRANLLTIIDALRSAAGSATPIVSMTYYDPFLGDWLAGGSVRSLALRTVPILRQFNGLLVRTYTKTGDQVADVQGAFGSTDLRTFVTSPWGSVPVAVDNACSLLDITCQAGMAEGFGDDPNDAGAVVIAKAFEATIGSLSS